MTALLRRELDFLDNAPVVIRRSQTVAVDIHHLFTVIAEEPAEWGHWCPGFTTASRWTTSGPPKAGSQRTMRAFGTDFHETVLAFEPNARFAFRVDDCKVPGLKAFVEEWTFVPLDRPKRLTLVTWSMGADSTLPVTLLRPFLRVQQTVLMKLAVRQLERRYPV